MTSVHVLNDAEKGLYKRCTGGCERRLALDAFYVKIPGKLTNDGRKLRMSICSRCFNRMRPQRNIATENTKARQRARGRALRRLAKVTPELFDILFEEELAKEPEW